MTEPRKRVRRGFVREILPLVLVAIAAATQVPDGAWNGAAHFALVQSLADGTPVIDKHLNQSGDIAYVNGHYYTAKAPGLALFSLPAYLVADALGEIPAGDPVSPPPSRYVSGRTMWNTNLTVVAAFLALLLVIRLTVNRLVPGAGTAVALMLGLGTMLLPLATNFFAHDLSALLAFAAFAAVVRERSRRSYWALAVAGLLAGLAIVVEFPAAIVATALALYVLADAPRARRLASYASGLLAGTAPLLTFNTWAFGSPLRTSYAHAVIDRGASGHDVLGANDKGLFGVTYPHLRALLDILVSERGLLVLTPITLVALAGLLGLARRGWRREAWLVAGLTIALLLYNASYYLPFGGYTPGPRFLVLLLPFLALPLAEAWTRWRVITLACAAMSAFWMVAASVAQPLLPTADHPTLWLSRVVHERQLSGSVLADGWAGAAMLVAPAVAAVLLVSSSTIAAHYSRRRAVLHASVPSSPG